MDSPVVRCAAPTSRRTLLVRTGASTIFCMVAMAGCTPGAPTAQQVDEVLSRLAAAVLAGNESEVQRCLAASSQPSRDRLTRSLARLAPTAFELRRVGPWSAGQGMVSVQWQLSGETKQTSHELAVTVSAAARSWALAPRVANPGARAPLWWIDPVEPLVDDQVGLLVSTGDQNTRGTSTGTSTSTSSTSAGGTGTGGTGTGGTGTGGPGDQGALWGGRATAWWADQARTALQRASQRTELSAAGRVWLEMPSTPSLLPQLIGGVPQPGVVAWTSIAGINAEAPCHLYLDPVATGALQDSEIAALLTHEMVHVLTNSPARPMSLWIEEGYAEVVTWAEDDAGGWSQSADLAARVAQGVVQPHLPGDREFAGGSLQDSYTWSWLFFRWLVEKFGWSRVNEWYRQQGSDADSADEVGRVVLGAAVSSLVPQWQEWARDELDRRG